MKYAIAETKTAYSIFIGNDVGTYDWFVVNKDRAADIDMDKETVIAILKEKGNGWINKEMNL